MQSYLPYRKCPSWRKSLNGEGDMTAGLQLNMKDVFMQCQNGMQCHGKLLKALQNSYKQAQFDEFWPEFNHYMKYSMIVFKREPTVERTVDFIAKFVTSTNPEPTEPETDPNSSIDEVAQNKLLVTVFDFLIESQNARDQAVRFRCCQMINKLLALLGENAQIDDELYDKIYESMLERLRDKFPVVRMHAVMALSRLQDPHDANCPVIKAYLFLVNSDPNPEVRRAVLSCIAPSTKTLPAILQRTRDTKDTVRKTAYIVMGEKVHIKALSIANRVQLLQDGLNDRSDMVKEACASKLLQPWLRTFQGNVLELLSSLDVESSTKTCQQALETLLKASPTDELVSQFDLLDENILVPPEKLTCESVMYWQVLCKYFHDMGSDGDADLEKVLPNCVEYCKYTSKLVDDLKNCSDIDQLVEKEFIHQELLMLIDYMDLADQASRKAVEKLFHDMLIADHVSHTMIKSIIPRLCEIRDNPTAVITYIAEMVSEIREPITAQERGVNPEEKRQIDIKIAQIRVKLNQAKEELEEAIKDQDFTKAADQKTLIAELELEKTALVEAGEAQVEEVRTEKTDVATILKCQTMVTEMLQALAIKALNPTLQMLMETLIIPGIQNEDAAIRTSATKSLGMCCLVNKELIIQYLPLFMQASQIDAEVVRAAALMVIFDLLHMHGLEAISDDTEDSDKAADTTQSEGDTGPPPSPAIFEQQKKEENRVHTASNLVAIISGFLDSESSELRTIAAEGMAKLLLSGRVVSSKILSHLLLLWYNPVTEDDTHLRHCLGTFFPLYAFACRTNQEIVEEAFMPTLKTLVNAPLSSPLAEVSVENVAELLVQLTNVRRLLENQSSAEKTITENPSHANIALIVSNEILSNPDTFNLKLWVKILNQLEMCAGEESAVKELDVLVDKIILVIKDKQCLRSMVKFQTTIKSLIPESSRREDESQEETTLPETGKTKEVASEKAEDSVLNESLDPSEMSSFFQEPKPIRRTTARSMSDKSRLESPGSRRLSQSSDGSTTPELFESPERRQTEKAPSDTPVVGIRKSTGKTKLAESFVADKSGIDSQKKTAVATTDKQDKTVTSVTKNQDKAPKTPTKRGKSGEVSSDESSEKGSKTPTKRAKSAKKSTDDSPEKGSKTPTKRAKSAKKSTDDSPEKGSKTPTKRTKSTKKSTDDSPVKGSKTPTKPAKSGKSVNELPVKAIKTPTKRGKSANESPEKVTRTPTKRAKSAEVSSPVKGAKTPTKRKPDEVSSAKSPEKSTEITSSKKGKFAKKPDESQRKSEVTLTPSKRKKSAKTTSDTSSQKSDDVTQSPSKRARPGKSSVVESPVCRKTPGRKSAKPSTSKSTEEASKTPTQKGKPVRASVKSPNVDTPTTPRGRAAKKADDNSPKKQTMEEKNKKETAAGQSATRGKSVKASPQKSVDKSTKAVASKTCAKSSPVKITNSKTVDKTGKSTSRSSSKSPAPAKSAERRGRSAKRTASKSPEKSKSVDKIGRSTSRSSSKSPVKSVERKSRSTKRSASKSPEKSVDRRGRSAKRSASKSPEKSKSVDKTGKSTSRSSSKSPAPAKSAERRGRSAKRTASKSPEKSKSVDKTGRSTSRSSSKSPDPAKSADRRGRSAKRSASNSPVKSVERRSRSTKRSASKSPEKSKSVDKRGRSTSKSSSKSPVKSVERRSRSTKRSASKSPEKSKSVDKKGGSTSRSSSKSPVKSVERRSRSTKRSASKSPEKSKSVDKKGGSTSRSSSKSPEKSADRKGRSAKRSASKSPEKSKSQSKAAKEKSVERKGRSTDLSPRKSPEKSKSDGRLSKDKSVERKGRTTVRSSSKSPDKSSSDSKVTKGRTPVAGNRLSTRSKLAEKRTTSANKKITGKPETKPAKKTKESDVTKTPTAGRTGARSQNTRAKKSSGSQEELGTPMALTRSGAKTAKKTSTSASLDDSDLENSVFSPAAEKSVGSNRRGVGTRVGSARKSARR